MNNIADLRYCSPEKPTPCYNVKLSEAHFRELPVLPDISKITSCVCFIPGCYWLLLLLLLIPISMALMYYMKWYVVPFIGELGGSSRDMDCSVSLKENPEENQFEMLQSTDIEASNFDSAPVGSTQTGNIGASEAVCGDDGHRVEARFVSEPEVNDSETPR